MTNPQQDVPAQAARLQAIESLRDQFQSRAQVLDEQAAFPYENFKDLRAAGLLALAAPTRYGGLGMWDTGSYTPYYEIVERLARFDSPTAQLLQVHSHALGILSRTATEAQAERFVAPIVRDGHVVASVGSESAPATTRGGLYTSELQRSPHGGWVLNCEKHFASLGPGADYLMLWIAVPGTGDYAARVTLVLVPGNAPEVELIDEWDVMGMRATVSWGVRITDYHVSDDAVFGAPGDWLLDPRTFTLGFTANHVGAAQGALDFAVAWVRQRPYLAASELVQHALGDLASDVLAARSALFAASAVWDEGRYDDAELLSLQALHVAKRVVLDSTRRAFEICGARSAFRLFPLEQMYRDARTFTLHFRDEQYTRNVGAALIDGSFSAKGYVEGSRKTASPS